MPGGRVHRGHVERLVDVIAITRLERVGDRVVVDDVAIELGLGVERRVEGLGHLPGAADPHVVGQNGVQGLDEDRSRVARCRVEVDDLAQGVHSGIGPAAGVGRRHGPRQLADRLLQHLLHRPPVGLALPAGEVGAVVAQEELDVPHGAGFVRDRPGFVRPHRRELEQLLGDLDGVGGGSLAEVVGDAPEEQGVGR